MNDGKPSKEQLDYYFKTSRKYFDELAAGYKVSDKKYYDEFITPYYGVFGQAKSGGGVKIFIFFMAIFMSSMAVLAFVVLSQKGVTFDEMFLFKDDPDETEVMYEIVTTTEKKSTSSTETTTDSKNKFNPTQQKQIDELVMGNLKTDLEKGFYYFGMENYDKAEEHLEKIQKGDKDYTPAQDVLKKIRKKKSETIPATKRIEKIN